MCAEGRYDIKKGKQNTHNKYTTNGKILHIHPSNDNVTSYLIV